MTPLFRGRRPAELSFGTSGLRGLVEELTDLEAYINVLGFLRYVGAPAGTPVALAGDLRPSTPRVLRAVARAAQDAGHPVRFQGSIPTPALTAWGVHLGLPSVMVTGSHIPFDRNGIKFIKPDGELLKDEEAAVLAQVARVRSEVYGQALAASPFDDQGALKEAPGLPPPEDHAQTFYLERYRAHVSPDALQGLRVGLYEHSAVGRSMLARILSGFGAEVIPFGRTEEFVAIDTEAITPHQLQTLARAVAPLLPLDAVVSTDGDSDRPLLLSPDPEAGLRFYSGDALGLVAARALGAEAAAVPVSVSDAVESTGLPTERTRIGSPWVIAAMRAMEARGARRVVGWEANGGFLVGSGWESQGLLPLLTRDAVLPLVLVLAEGRRVGGLPQVFQALPARFRAAGLLDSVPPEAGQAILGRFTRPEGTRGARFRGRPAWLDQDGTERPPSDHPEAWEALQAELTHAFSAWGVQGIAGADWLDGIRVETAAGQVLHVRPSGNAPQLRLYVTASNPNQAETLLQAGLRTGGILESWIRAVSKRSSP